MFITELWASRRDQALVLPRFAALGLWHSLQVMKLPSLASLHAVISPQDTCNNSHSPTQSMS